MAAKYRILYIDDEVDNLKVFKIAFQNEFAVTIESSPLKGLDLIRNEEFEILVVDQRMPEMTGVEVLENAMQLQRDSVRILLTGYSDMQATINAVNKGKIFYYLSKPWKKEEVKGILLKAIDHYELTKKNKELISRLSQSINELQVFLYRASHDLKAPITTQLGLLNLLREEVTGDSKIYVAKIEEVISRLEKTIDKIRELSDLGYDFVSKNYTSEIAAVVEKVLEKWNQKLQVGEIQVKLNLKQSNDFTLESGLLEMIIDELIENSINFHNKNQTDKWIEIASDFDAPSNMLKLSVKDNGIGIDPTLLDEVTDPFFRGTALSTGNGLGLYIVKRVCDLIHGSIAIHSDGKSGTEVTISIPNLKK
ncbi:MAG: hybrid sensor histidine kinase/response regulator [Cyclobacteriaceae bacterium]|nr:hybrid sensor histidine kinase/response regulator [Cyclobacteriaceae bacterium]